MRRDVRFDQVRRLTTATVFLGLLAAAGSPAAQAQSWGYDHYHNDGPRVVRCESMRNRTQECGIDGRARLVRQLSGSPCIEGKTWGQSLNGIWVTQGCRAEFISERRGESGRLQGWNQGPGYVPRVGGDGRGQVIQCDSNDRRERRCNVTVRRDVRLLKQNSGSPCVEGSTWGYDRNGIWVNGGCRGQFMVN